MKEEKVVVENKVQGVNSMENENLVSNNNETFVKENIKFSILPSKDINESEWDELLNKSSETTYFCTTQWWKTYEGSYFLLAKDEKGKLIAGVPFRILSVIPVIGKYFKFSWLDSSVLVDECFKKEDIHHLKKTVFEYLVKHLKKENAVVMFVSTKSTSLDGLLFKELFNSSEKCATIINDLTLDEDKMYAAFKKTRRYSVRKATKLGVEVKILEGEDAFSLIPDYCHLQKKLFEHKSAYYSSIYYKSESYLKSILTASKDSYIAMAYHEGKPVAGNIMVSHKKMMHAYLGASDNKLNRETDGSSLLEYEMMKYAKQKGYEEYDLVGIQVNKPEKTDGLYGVYLYKTGFGGEIKVYDCCTYAIRKKRYMFVWWLRKFENNPIAQKLYNILKGKNSN